MKPITHLSLNLAPDDRVNSMLLSLRVVPDGRDGKVVYGRTLRWGEVDDGLGVEVREGESFEIRKGRLVVELEHVDSLSETGRWGYAPVTNTIWTWYQIGKNPDATVYLALSSLARRVDTAYALWAMMMAARESIRDGLGFGPADRASIFEAWGAAEVAVIAVHRAFRLMRKLESWLGVEIPASVVKVAESVQALRDALEHIDERAEGLVRGRSETVAHEIFEQGQFVTKGALSYGDHELRVETELLEALVGCRSLIITVAKDKLGRSVDPRASKNVASSSIKVGS